MEGSQIYSQALEKLREVLTLFEARNPDIKDIVSNRDAVLARYQPIFNSNTINGLREEDFRSFLYFENNHHWSSLYRQVNSLCADMSVLRKALKTLLDESLPLPKRFDDAVSQVKGLGKGIATAILLVESPDKHGVWNGTSEAALKALRIWPNFPSGSTAGQKYERINQLLNQLAKDLSVDLWTLDALMWGALPEKQRQEASEDLHELKEFPIGEQAYLIDIIHPELRSRLQKLSSAPLDTVIREAGVIFETYLRNKVDPTGNLHGVELVDNAFKPGGKLMFSIHAGEQQGVQFLFRGAMQFIRNPPMHRLIDYPETMAHQFLRLIDSLMLLLDQASE